MTDATPKTVTCSSCGNIYQGLYYRSLGIMATGEQKQKAQSGELNMSTCPKCNTKNKVTENLPHWVEHLKAQGKI